MAERFTCAVEKEEYRSACEGLDFYGEYEGKRFCVLHFPGEGKREDFEHVKKSKLADSEKNYDFGGTIFPEGTSNFEGAEFDGNAIFAGATFFGDANFERAQFSGEWTFFTEAQFGGVKTNFTEVQFSGESTDFTGAQFSGGVGTYFQDATFLNEVDFGEATFREKVTFWGKKAHPVFTSDAWAWFDTVRIEKPEQFTFNTVLLHPGWFVNVDVRKVDFTDVRWYGMPGGPEVTLEEEINEIKERGVESPHSLLAQACRRLSANAEENREYPLANEFHYWAMDAVRKGSWNHFKGLNLRGLLKKETWHDIGEHFGLITNLYWALSGYGVRAARAFWILFAIWLVFAAVYFLLVESSPFWVFSASSIWQGLDYARQAAAYSLSALVRLNPRPQSAGLSWFQTLVTIEGILGPLQIALLVLAVRRQVMR